MFKRGTTARTGLIGSLAASFLVSCLQTFHAQAAREVNVGVLVYFTETEARITERALADALRARPGRPGLSYRVTVLHSPYDDDATAAAVLRLRALRPDIVLVSSPILVTAVLPHIPDVPIVSAGEAFIENLPYVKSVAQPGGRVTGFFRQVNQLSKRIELLQGFCPGVRRVGTVNSASAASDPVFLEFLVRESTLLRKGGIALTPLFLNVDEFSSLPVLIRQHSLDALDVIFTLAVRDRLAEVRAALAAPGIPYVFNRAEAVENGGAFAAQPASFDFVKTGAEYIARVASGEKAGDIPIQISRAYDIVIDTKLVQQFKGCDARRIARIATRFHSQ